MWACRDRYAEMKVLVTGATGFIGRRLLTRLRDHHEVFALARGELQPGEDVSVIAADLARPLDLNALPAEIDVIIHLAQAKVSPPGDAHELLAVNTLSTRHLLDYGRGAGARRFILASTGDVYGRRFGLCKESDTLAPDGDYALTKHSAEMLTQTYSAYSQTCILRFFHPYGPEQFERLIPMLASRIERRQAVQLNQGDRPNLTPIYIDDAVTAIERAVDSSYSGVVNIAGDQVVSVRRLAEQIGSVLKVKPVFNETDMETADLSGDNQLMKEVFGGWPMITLSDGLARTFKREEAAGCQTRA